MGKISGGSSGSVEPVRTVYNELKGLSFPIYKFINGSVIFNL
jgi:hypothetical protein